MTATAMTYTIALYEDMLLAVVPDGADIAAACEAEAKAARICYVPERVQIIGGVTLTDDETAGDVLYRGHACGCLQDETGRFYEYAVKAAA